MPNPARTKNKRRVVNSSNAYVVEGETEKAYLEQVLSIKPPDVIKNPNCTDAKNLVNFAITLLEDGGYQNVYVVFDQDQLKHNSPELQQLEAKKRNEPVYFITSSPCFEYALALHFKETTSSNTTDLNKIIKKKGIEFCNFNSDKDHKDGENREKLMKCLINPSQGVKTKAQVAQVLKTKDELLGLNLGSPLKERFHPDKTPNSLLYEVIKLTQQEASE